MKRVFILYAMMALPAFAQQPAPTEKDFQLSVLEAQRNAAMNQAVSELSRLHVQLQTLRDQLSQLQASCPKPPAPSPSPSP